MEKEISIYEQQAMDFAGKCGLTMQATYLGHYARFNNHITAVYKITLTRPNRQPYMFNFSTSINSSWRYTDRNYKVITGLPYSLNKDYFFKNYEPGKSVTFKDLRIEQTKKAPSLYNVLTCLTKYNPGFFEEFCRDYGYDEDSIQAKKVYESVVDEYRAVYRLFSDVIEELSDIN